MLFSSQLLFHLVCQYFIHRSASQWNFFSDPDPTHGLINYQTKDNAISKHLAYVENGTTYLTVDANADIQPGGNRDS